MARSRILDFALRASMLCAVSVSLACQLPSEAPTPTPTPAAAPTPTSAPEPVLVHEVKIASNPSGARVLYETAELGTTPYLLRFKQPMTVTVQADGYAPKGIALDARSDVNVVVILEPLPVDEPAQPSEHTAPVASRPRPRPDPAPTTVQQPTPPRPASSLPYPNVLAAKADYQAGKIDRDAYDQAVRKLKTRRAGKLDALKDRYQAGAIDRGEYQRLKRIIDNEYKGE